MTLARYALAAGLALSATGVSAASIAVSVLGNPFVFFEIPTQPNGDVRGEQLNLVACDGSVRLATEACDGSVRVEEIAIDISATRNPGTSVGVGLVGDSPDFEITVAFVSGWVLADGPYDLTLQGQFELERLRDKPGFDGGVITLTPSPVYPLMPDFLTGGRFGTEFAIVHGTGPHVLGDGMDDTFASGPLLTGGEALLVGQVLCLSGSCTTVDAIVSMRVLNPGEALRRARVDAQMTWEPGTLAPIPLPAAGWMLLAGLGALGTLARRRAA